MNLTNETTEDLRIALRTMDQLLADAHSPGLERIAIEIADELSDRERCEALDAQHEQEEWYRLTFGGAYAGAQGCGQ